MKTIGKHICILAVAILLPQLSFQLMAANTMKLSNHTVGANQVFTVRVDIENTSAFTAFQLDVPVPAGFSYIANSAVFDTARVSTQSLQAEMVPGNKLRIVGYSQNNVLFEGDSGTIVRFQIRSGYTPGTFPLTMQNPVIGDTNGVNILTSPVNGSVLLQAPDINITATSINFDRTPLGQSTTRNLTIQNTGNLPLNVTGVTFSSSYFEVVGNSSFTVNPGANYQLTVKFNSVIRGQYNKIMTITSNDPDEGTLILNLIARAFAVNELHTGTMFAYSGKQATLSYSINNMDPFTGFQFDVQLPSPMTYVPGSAILTGRKTNHVVSANTIPGNKLRVVAYSPNKQVFGGSTGNVVTLTFNVNGTGGSYPLTLSNVVIGDTNSQNCLSDSYNGSLTVASPLISSATTLAFGDVSVLTFKQLPLRVFNYGTDTLKISSIQLTNASFVLLTTYPLQILPGQYSDLQLKFQQSVKGGYAGQMKMFTNDPVRPIYLVTLSGTAFTPNYLLIPALSCKNIDSVWVPVKVNNIEPFVAFQFDLEFPSCMHYITGSGVLTSRVSNASLTVQTVNATKIRVLAYSILQNPFTGDTGTIVNLRFAVNSSNQNVTSGSLSLSGAIVGNALMQNILYHSTNGTITFRFPHILSGTLVYNNSSNTPMDSAWMILQQNGLKLDSVRTTTSGAFSFQNIYDGIYRIKGKTHKPWSGVNGTDALKVQRHFAGLELLTIPIRLTGADVNNSNSINGTDALKIKRRFAGLDTIFARPDWIFEKNTGSDSVVMVNSNTTVSFYALCTGDVNGSYVPTTGAKSGQALEISNSTTIPVAANQEIYLPITVDQDCDMGAFSVVLDFPASLVDVMEVSFVGGQPYYSVKGGRLNIVWSELNGLMVSRHEPFAFIKVRTSASFTADDIVAFTNASPLTELADRSGSAVRGAQISIPSLSFLSDNNGSGFQLYPNPAISRSFLFFNTSEEGTATVRVFDVLGRCVESVGPVSAVKGLNKMDLDFSHLKKNLYKLSFEFSGPAQSFKEVKSIVAGN